CHFDSRVPQKHWLGNDPSFTIQATLTARPSLPEIQIMSDSPTSRRTFLQTSVAVGAGVAAYLDRVPSVHAAGSDTIRVGLIGCGSPRGGRGRGAAQDCVTAGDNVKLVAMADMFKDHIDYTLNDLRKLGPEKIDVAED